MNNIRTITATEMRGINRTAILELIRREGPISRSVIAEKLQASLPTVMRIVDDLTEEELVRPSGVREWSGGRRRPLIELNIGEHLTIGVDLGGVKFFGAVADLGGNILYEKLLPKYGTGGEDSYHNVVTLIEDLLVFARSTGRKIRGIGVGAPGVTQHESGIIEWAPSLKWRNFPLRDRLKTEFQLPVVVDNDVNLSALGEMWFGMGQNVDNFVLIMNGTGIGAGIVMGGALYRGSRQAAGEIGYLMPGKEFLNRNYPDFGPLETLVAGSGIAQRARLALAGTLSADKLECLSAEDVFDAFRRGEEWARPIVEDTVDYLAIAIATVSTFFDPEMIILSGGVSRSADLLIDPILKRISGKIPFLPALVSSTLGPRGAVMGAVINLLHNTSDFYVVRKLS